MRSPAVVRDALGRQPVAYAIPLAAVIALAAFVIHLIAGRFWIDLTVYREGGSAVLHGASPYAFVDRNGLMFTYPPFAAALFAPLGLVGIGTDVGLWTFASVLTLEACVWVTLGLAGMKPDRRRAMLMVAVTAVMLPLLPVASTVWNGQINFMLLLLVLADLVRPGSIRTRGVGVGLAAGIKLTPLIFIPYLLITRQRRAAVTSTVCFAATVLAGFLLLPGGSRTYWGGAFLDTSRVIPPGEEVFNQSLRGVLNRTPVAWPHAMPVWLVACAVVGAGGLAVAAWAARRGHGPAGIFACAVTGLLVSPVSWHYHWVWCVPMVILWARRALRDGARREALGVVLLWLVFFVSVSWVPLSMGGHLAHPAVWLLVFTDLYVLTGLAALAGIAVFLWKERAKSAHQLADRDREQQERHGDPDQPVRPALRRCRQEREPQRERQHGQ